ncbi:methyltransferase [Streptomyces sp. NPDC054796]
MRESETSPQSASQVMQLATGFWASQTLAASIEVGLFDFLHRHGPATISETASHLKLADRPARMILAACASLGLLDKPDQRYSLNALSRTYLVSSEPDYFGGLIGFLSEHTYLGWHRLTEALRNDRPTTWDSEHRETLFDPGDDLMNALFWKATHALSSDTARRLARQIDFSGSRRLLDVGGGSGAFPIEICRTHTHLTGAVFDLPHVCELSKSFIRDAGLEDRVETRPGDFITDAALPGGYDTIVLSMIMHDWDPDTDRLILAKCFEALPRGGTLMICEFFLNEERTGPPEAALMGLTMLVETLKGDNYSHTDYAAWLADAGFTGVELHSFQAAGANGVLLARKP